MKILNSLKNKLNPKFSITLIAILSLFILLYCNGKNKVKNKQNAKIFVYSDGSGNSYKVYMNANAFFVDFNPVAPKFSSSGNYSGGEKKQIKVDKDFYEKTGVLFDKAFNNQTIHLEKRIMTSGFVKIKNGGEKSVIINGSTEENLAIKKHFNSILKK